MTIAELQGMRANVLSGGDDPRSLPQPRMPGSNEAGFSKTLTDAINSVDEAQKVAGEEVTAFISGEQENVHEVMIALNKAQLSFQLMTEVRNKMMDTYHELMRMQV